MVRDPKDVVQVGQEVKVKVVSVDRYVGSSAWRRYNMPLMCPRVFQLRSWFMNLQDQGEASVVHQAASG